MAELRTRVQPLDTAVGVPELCLCLPLTQSARSIFMQEAGDQRLIRQAFLDCPLLNRLEILA